MPRSTLRNIERHSLSDEEVPNSPDSNDRQSGGPMSKRGHLVKELVDTQMHFVTDMTQLLDAMKAQSNLITEDDGRALFVALSDVVQISTKLNKLWNQELLRLPSYNCDQARVAGLAEPFRKEITRAFLEYSTKYDVTVSFKSDAMGPFVECIVERLKEHKPLLTDLDTELIKPVQRMFKYSQLFEQLKDNTEEKHADYSATCEMFECFRHLLRKANEDKRWNEIITEVFQHIKPRSRKKSLKRLIFGEKLPSDPKLAQEKWKLNALRRSAVAINKWISDEFKYLDNTFKLEKKFLESALHFCEPDGNICLHDRIGWNPSQYPVSCDYIAAQMSVTDTISTNMTFVTMPKLARNVTDRMEELITLLHDPDLLIEQLDKTEKDLISAQALLRQTEMKNQSTTSIRELCTELEHTKQTLRENLLLELPVLLRAAEKMLLQISSYACLLLSDMTKVYANRMKHHLDQAKRNSQGSAQMNTTEFTNYLDETLHKISPEKHRKGLFPSTPGLRCSFRKSVKKSLTNLTKPLVMAVDPNNDWDRPVEYRSHRLQPHHSFSNGSSSRSRNERGPHMSTGSVSNTLDAPERNSNTRSPSPLDYRHPPRPPTPPSVRPSKATHRVLYDFNARNANEISVLSGQSVIVLADRDEAGNDQWCRIAILPDHKRGYVPANYLQPL